MGKSISPAPLADSAWLQYFQTVSTKVDQLRKQHKPDNPQNFTNGVWAKHLRQLISGGAK